MASQKRFTLKQTEKYLLRQCIEYLKYYCLDREDLYWFHDYDPIKNNAGFPDLFIIYKHRIILVELKSKKGKLRPEQETVKELSLRWGHPYYIIRDIEAFRDLMYSIYQESKNIKGD